MNYFAVQICRKDAAPPVGKSPEFVVKAESDGVAIDAVLSAFPGYRLVAHGPRPMAQNVVRLIAQAKAGKNADQTLLLELAGAMETQQAEIIGLYAKANASLADLLAENGRAERLEKRVKALEAELAEARKQNAVGVIETEERA